MDTFEEYLRQGEPDKAERAEIWKTAIGLQKQCYTAAPGV